MRTREKLHRQLVHASDRLYWAMQSHSAASAFGVPCLEPDLETFAARVGELQALLDVAPADPADPTWRWENV